MTAYMYASAGPAGPKQQPSAVKGAGAAPDLCAATHAPAPLPAFAGEALAVSPLLL